MTPPRKAVPVSEKCPKCGAARKPKWSGYECGSNEHHLGMPFQQSLGCRITELTRHVERLRQLLKESCCNFPGSHVASWTDAEIDAELNQP